MKRLIRPRLLATRRCLAALSLTAVLAVCGHRGSASASPTLSEISTDPFNAPTIGQHHSEVEPDTFAFGNMEVAVFQVGRISDGGATKAGWATYTNGAWQNGLLPALTTNQNPQGSFPRVSDPSIAYDAKHGVSSLRWYAAGSITGFNVYNGSIKINRQLVTSRTHWYHFATRRHLHHVRILAVRP